MSTPTVKARPVYDGPTSEGFTPDLIAVDIDIDDGPLGRLSTRIPAATARSLFGAVGDALHRGPVDGAGGEVGYGGDASPDRRQEEIWLRLGTYVAASAEAVGLAAVRRNQPGAPTWDVTRGGKALDGPAGAADVERWLDVSALALRVGDDGTSVAAADFGSDWNGWPP